MKNRFLLSVILCLSLFSCARKNTAFFNFKQDLHQPYYSTTPNEIYASTSKEFVETQSTLPRANISLTDSSGCDVVFFKDGKEINAKILEINQREIIYRLCNDPNSPPITVAKSSIFLIKYANGTKEVMESAPTPVQQPNTIQNQTSNEKSEVKLNNQIPVKRKLSTLALLSFIIPIVGLIIFGIPAGITGIVLGIVSYIKIEKNKDKLKGQGFSIAGIALGATILIITLLALVILLG